MIRDTLLIIDDSELDLAILNEIFKKIFKVECLSNANQAVNFIVRNHEKICAVLLDICLGRKGAGFSVLEQIHQYKETKNLPIILITSDANESNVLDGIHYGAVDFLAKPVDPHHVQKRVCDRVKATWKGKETILDAVGKNTTNKNTPTETIEKNISPLLWPDSLSIKDIEKISNVWKQQMSLLCQFRKNPFIDQYQRISHITTLLAKTYVANNTTKDLNDEDATLIGLAANFYDIGFLGIPDEVIEAGENQKEPTRNLYLKHSSVGRDFFKVYNSNHPFLRYCSDIAYWHHKNYDGTGYPETTTVVSIPISAQLVRTALRCDFYARHYFKHSDYIARMLNALMPEVGSIISEEMYGNVVQCKGELFELMNTLFN